MTARLVPPLRIALAGAGAFGRKHLDALAVIEEADVVAVGCWRIFPSTRCRRGR
jgi:predicted dehydrogenase